MWFIAALEVFVSRTLFTSLMHRRKVYSEWIITVLGEALMCLLETEDCKRHLPSEGMKPHVPASTLCISGSNLHCKSVCSSLQRSIAFLSFFFSLNIFEV